MWSTHRTPFAQRPRRRPDRCCPGVDALEARALLSGLTVGGIVSDKIGAEAEVDLFTFEGTEGQRIELITTSSAVDGAFDAVAEVYDPSGGLFTTLNPLQDRGVLALPEDGTYLVLVRDRANVHTGRYAIGLESLLPPSPDAEELTLGGIAEGSIDSPIEKDLFTFEGTEGQRIELITTSSAVDGAFDAVAEVYDPSGGLFTTLNPLQDRGVLALPEDGTYLVLVRDRANVHTGRYAIGLESLLPPSPDAEELTLGGIAEGSIDSPIEKDLFTFEGTEDDQIELVVTSREVDDRFSTSGEVYAPSGAFVVSLRPNAPRELILEESGTYLVLIRDASNRWRGRYTIGLADGSPPEEPAPEEPAPDDPVPDDPAPDEPDPEVPRRDLGGDYDGDGRADLALYSYDRSTGEGVFEIRWSSGERGRRGRPDRVERIGGLNASDIPIAADFDGDGRTDLAVVQPLARRGGSSVPNASVWIYIRSSDGQRVEIPFGAAGSLDRPAPADYDGDGRDDIATFRPDSDLTPGAADWFILPSSTDRAFRVSFGAAGGTDLPAPADYDGDGRDDIATFRPDSDLVPGAAQWFILPSGPNDATYSRSLGAFPVTFGAAGNADQPAPADYNGDGRDDIAAFRSESDLAPGQAQLFVLPSLDAAPRFGNGFPLTFGVAGVSLAMADYDGDRRPDVASFDANTGRWTIRETSTGSDRTIEFGSTGETVVPVLAPLYFRLLISGNA